MDNYEVEEELLQEFFEYSINFAPHIVYENHKGQIKNILKASIAQQLFGSNTYEFILNQNDPMLKKVMELDESIKTAQLPE